MSGDMLMQYLNERLLKRKQIPIHVSNMLKKPTTRGKIEPLGFQKIEHKNRHVRVTWLIHFVMSFGTGKCMSQHVLLHLKE